MSEKPPGNAPSVHSPSKPLASRTPFQRASSGAPPAARHAPATERNREPIVTVLRGCLPASGRVVEVASGTGEHAMFLARSFPNLMFQPTDVDDLALASIEAWRQTEDLENLLAPLRLDASFVPWAIPPAEAVLNINMIHIAPWSACQGLMEGAAGLLSPAGILYLYGPFRRQGRHTAPSNADFDASLRQRDPRWGVRDLEAVVQEASRAGFRVRSVEGMPANNLSVILEKS